jgi:hypothetical protein
VSLPLHRPPHGAKRPDPAKLAARLAKSLHHAHQACLDRHVSGETPLPTSVDNSLQPATDQGQTSSCTAHSLVKGVEILTGFKGSMHVLYSLTGTLEKESPLADDGRQCIDCLEVVSTQGLAPFAGPTPDGRNSDVTDTNVCVPATDSEVTEASLHKFCFGENSIDPAATNLSDLLASCLAAKGVVYLGTEVGQAFESLSGDTVAQPDPVANDPNGGGHALIIVGYRTNAAGVREFKVQNSWSVTWDLQGTCWVSLAWCAACWELHPLLPIPAPVASETDFEDKTNPSLLAA